MVSIVGIYRSGKYQATTNGKTNVSYRTWADMLERCYVSRKQDKCPTYKGCSVVSEWREYQLFAEWFSQHYQHGWDLDKDAMFHGNKIYSPEFCVYLPHQINSQFSYKNHNGGKYPVGVTYIGKTGKFLARLSICGVTRNVGTFSSPDKAHARWVECKKKEMARLCDVWGHLLDDRIIVALLNYPFGEF